MQRMDRGKARQCLAAETQRETETREDGADAAVRPAELRLGQVCELCGSSDCPGANSANVRQAIRRGKALDAPPYGFAEAWCSDGGRMLVSEGAEESEALQNILMHRSCGVPWRDIADWLNEVGIRTRDGGPWTWPRVRAVARFVYRDQWLLPD